MFQDIEPHTLNIGYFQNQIPENEDYLIAYNNNQILIHEEEKYLFPTIADILRHHNINVDQLIYLFNIDGKKFFLSSTNLPETDNLKYQDIRSFRSRHPRWLCFGGATAIHLARWYENNRFCGKCAEQMVSKENERALHCPRCGLIVYPRINPVVIVGITNGEQLLLAKNANSEYKNYGLISGFMETGETLEDTIKREVMEEVGLKVKNTRYYKSQPWAFSESILMGFFAEVDGSTKPILDGEELSEATWFTREELPTGDSHFSLTWDMIEQFRTGSV